MNPENNLRMRARRGVTLTELLVASGLAIGLLAMIQLISTPMRQSVSSGNNLDRQRALRVAAQKLHDGLSCAGQIVHPPPGNNPGSLLVYRDADNGIYAVFLASHSAGSLSRPPGGASAAPVQTGTVIRLSWPRLDGPMPSQGEILVPDATTFTVRRPGTDTLEITLGCLDERRQPLVITLGVQPRNMRP